MTIIAVVFYFLAALLLAVMRISGEIEVLWAVGAALLVGWTFNFIKVLSN